MMKRARVLLLAVLMAASSVALGQEASQKNADLEKTLEDVNLQWLCAGKYHKAKTQDCVNFRSQYWADQFFEIGRTGNVQTKAEMVATQTANATAHPDSAPGTGPNPQDFKLMAVYGNIALATDLTIFKAVDANGQLQETGRARVLRMFVKEKGKWRPAGAALVPIAAGQ